MLKWIDIRKELPWLGRESIYFVNEAAERVLIEELSKLGFHIAVMDGSNINDEEAFFSEVSSVLTFPKYFGRNWDAFADCFGDLQYRSEKRRAIIWKQASASLRANPYMFIKATHELLNAATDLGRCDPAKNEPVQIEVFFLGEEPAFTKRPSKCANA